MLLAYLQQRLCIFVNNKGTNNHLFILWIALFTGQPFLKPVYNTITYLLPQIS